MLSKTRIWFVLTSVVNWTAMLATEIFLPNMIMAAQSETSGMRHLFNNGLPHLTISYVREETAPVSFSSIFSALGDKQALQEYLSDEWLDEYWSLSAFPNPVLSDSIDMGEFFSHLAPTRVPLWSFLLVSPAHSQYQQQGGIADIRDRASSFLYFVAQRTELGFTTRPKLINF